MTPETKILVNALFVLSKGKCPAGKDDENLDYLASQFESAVKAIIKETWYCQGEDVETRTVGK